MEKTLSMKETRSTNGVEVWFQDIHWRLIPTFGELVEVFGGPSRTEAVEQMLQGLIAAAERPVLDELDRDALAAAKNGEPGLTVSRSMSVLWVCQRGVVLYKPERCSETVRVLGDIDSVSHALERIGLSIQNARPVNLATAYQTFLRHLTRPRDRHNR